MTGSTTGRSLVTTALEESRPTDAHLSAVWSDVGAWWGDGAVRSALQNFNYRFNRQPSDLVGDIVDEIRDLADGRHGRFRIGPIPSA